jgi:citrate synthase
VVSLDIHHTSLSMNGIFSTISNLFTFVLSSSKDSERVFQQLVFQVLCLAFFRAIRNPKPGTRNRESFFGHGIHTQGDPRAERLFQVAQETKVYGRYCDLLRKIGKLAEERVGRRLPVNVTGAIGAISMDMGLPWQMSKSFAILGRALGGIAHVGEEVRRPIARGISDLVRKSLQYEPEK